MKKLIILISVILLVSININAGYVSKPISGNINTTRMDNFTTKEQEETLELECWMMDRNIWTVDTQVFNVEQEDTLALESWMISDNVWN